MDADKFKQLMAGVPAPVTVVTTQCDGKPHGATVSSFASLSLEPRLISIALIEGSALLAHCRKARRFAVNLLGFRQTELALKFASRCDDRFADIPWASDRGLPRLAGASAFVVCELFQEVQGGDHALLFGQVLDAEITAELPLIYSARKFGTNSKLIADRSRGVSDSLLACAS